ncbi:hypothetical protein SPRG_15008 [Saprolegnia parasitica CBS 223.65]|uniref:TAZ-type domain-containing protein n=1 Tax=Saprolegnia parasitica (strain CBS 223.65) TaxID=695850 RepID=A0A067BKQ4_SAPPC|nr:hypothetical protein SPRG_15008 [Saprolegnia parasitica CBS 223.65]KDO19054.1 hypothetical protein SPRG_15008 [Saprolegnia parasitica CBS 223.65]|eukprot:XP_012210242.1 hypothetical protein SPRG_15008 [Saprolegnia parasitica CBS 223.65]
MALLQLKKRRLLEDDNSQDDNDQQQQHAATKRACVRPNPVLQTEKMQSVLRGLRHVATCVGCDNKLCASTLAFVKKVELHLATQPAGHDRSTCAACKLWTMIVQDHARDCAEARCLVPLCATYRRRRDDPPI